jgi:cytosine/uracil/thiamine/allantoin permease
MAKKERDTYQYKGWLNSDSFMKRAFGVWGYSTVAGLILMGLFYLAILVLILLGLIISSILS